MSDIVIKAENISKQYRLGQIGTGTLSHDLNRWWYKIRGKDDPYLKIGETNDRTQKGNSDYVWALKDINFEVNKGEIWGIIGKNGAGKSTFLKILSKVTAPTSGIIKYKGHLASLLEVGTGFHGELTGRENVYLNGAILGMKRKEISRKMDEIIEFAGVEKYIDTPVKRYSSGMYVRLAFAVAAHLDTDILVLDEVLAVGDAGFQRKCLGKMNDAATQQGKTVLFVSHNLTQVQGLCNKGMLLENGKLTMTGDINKVLNEYTFAGSRSNLIDLTVLPKGGPWQSYFNLYELEIKNLSRDTEFFYEEDNIELIYKFISKEDAEQFFLDFSISSLEVGSIIECRSTSTYKQLNIKKDTYYTISAKVNLCVKSGTYQISLAAHYLRGLLTYVPSVGIIDIMPKETDFEAWNHPNPGLLITKSEWEILNESDSIL